MMGWIERVRISSFVWGGLFGGGSFDSARVDIKMAPTPIGPKSTQRSSVSLDPSRQKRKVLTTAENGFSIRLDVGNESLQQEDGGDTS